MIKTDKAKRPTDTTHTQTHTHTQYIQCASDRKKGTDSLVEVPVHQVENEIRVDAASRYIFI